jgi:aspartate/methionine/tyrosine aminotransferase
MLIVDLLKTQLKWKGKYDISSASITIHSGCGSAVSNTIQALVNDGQGILIPEPFYGGFDFDSGNYTRCALIPVASELPDFMPTIASLEEAYQSSKVEVRILILTNPTNPTGTCIPIQLMNDILNWASNKPNLHVVFDEIYALSANHSGSGLVPFHSLYSLDIPDSMITRVHLIWGFSKDFTLNGIRLGATISLNERFIQALQGFCTFTNISSITDRLALGLLSDKDWVSSFLSRNKVVLREYQEFITNWLESHSLSYVEPSSAFFIWINLERYCSTLQDEIRLWNAFIDAGVLLSPGHAFHSSRLGWFRLVYSFEKSILQMGLERMEGVLAVWIK